MSYSDKKFLSQFGWDDFFERDLTDNDRSSLAPSNDSTPSATTLARVVGEEKNLYRLQSGPETTFWASVRGKMHFEAQDRSDYPSVGDWVIATHDHASNRGMIERVLARKTLLYRRQAGIASGIQILSANIDQIFIVTSLNEDLNDRRLERYLAIAREAGATPVILLSKADLCPDRVEDVVSDTKVRFRGVDVHALSVHRFDQATFLESLVQKGTTSVFLGSSGVGKSTLVNFLTGEDLAKTQGIREGDAKGRHTTTARHLYVSRYGGLVIDTPGMRELQLLDHAEGIKNEFSDVEPWIQRCRFTDCGHETEPGCAVREALERGSLSEERWQSYQKLQAEVRFEMRKNDKAEAAKSRKIWKKRSVMAKERDRFKRRGFVPD